MIIPVKNNSNDDFLNIFYSTCVSKLESRMLITITNSNSSPEVNSCEVSLKSQCEFRVYICIYAKTSFGRRSLHDLCVCAHLCLYTNSFLLSRIRILKTNCNHHSSYKISLMSINGPIILKTNCNHHYNDHSSYEFPLVCNRSLMD